MKKLFKKLKNLIPSRRKIIQLYFALLFNANVQGFVTGNIYNGDTKKICAPGINCYSCPGAVGACPLGSIQGAISSGKSTLYYVLGILMLYGLLLGRFICGFLCPFGLIQELLYKIHTPKLKKSWVTRLLSYFKYVLLVFFVVIVPIMYAFRDMPLPAFCKYICPAGTLEGGLGLLSNKVNESYFSMLGPLFTWKFLLLVSIVVGSVFVFRLFCRFICPLGAFYGFFNKISLFGIKLDKPKCIGCNLCISKCKMDIKHVGDHECISCGECIPVCPTKAISFKGSKIFLPPDEVYAEDEELPVTVSAVSENATVTARSEHKKKIETRDEFKKRTLATAERVAKRNFIIKIVVWVAMLALLIGALFYYNSDFLFGNSHTSPANDTGTPVTVSEGEDAPPPEELVFGSEVGNLCIGYDLPIINSDGETGEYFNLFENTGKITIINFWGTWCNPCVAELPYFERIASEYADGVTVVAVHTYSIKDTAPEFIGTHYQTSNIIFTVDSEGESYYTALGGRDTHPHTVIVDENGVIVASFVGSVTYETLKGVVDENYEPPLAEGKNRPFILWAYIAIFTGLAVAGTVQIVISFKKRKSSK